MSILRPEWARAPSDPSADDGIGPTSAELEALALSAPTALLRRGPGRETFHWRTAGGLETVVKRFQRGPGLEGWRERLHARPARGPARREYEHLGELAALGLSVPAALACHESPGSGGPSLVVMERIAHRSTLRQRLERHPGEATRWLAPLLELVTGLHRAGWYHRDLYLDHLLVATSRGAVQPGREGPERLVLIDVGRARREIRPRRRWFVKDLAALWHSTPAGVSRSVAMRFLRAWLLARGIDGRRAQRRFLRAVLAKERRMAGHIPRGGTSFPRVSGENP